MKNDEPGLTLGELKAKLDALTPEQLAMPVIWCGEMRGGFVQGFDVLEEDHIDPSGDGMEPISLYAKERAAEQDITIEEAERLTREEEGVVARKGQALLLTE